MGLQERPEVILLPDGAKFWEHTYDDFYLKAYVPATDIKGQVHNYGFRAPLLTVFEEEPQSIVDAATYARNTGLADIASACNMTEPAVKSLLFRLRTKLKEFLEKEGYEL